MSIETIRGLGYKLKVRETFRKMSYCRMMRYLPVWQCSFVNSLGVFHVFRWIGVVLILIGTDGIIMRKVIWKKYAYSRRG
jgi:hypothetical protein